MNSQPPTTPPRDDVPQWAHEAHDNEIFLMYGDVQAGMLFLGPRFPIDNVRKVIAALNAAYAQRAEEWPQFLNLPEEEKAACVKLASVAAAYWWTRLSERDRQYVETITPTLAFKHAFALGYQESARHAPAPAASELDALADCIERFPMAYAMGVHDTGVCTQAATRLRAQAAELAALRADCQRLRKENVDAAVNSVGGKYLKDLRDELDSKNGVIAAVDRVLEEQHWIHASRALAIKEGVAALRRELEALTDEKANSEFWLAHAKQTNSELEKDYLAIWKAVKRPDKTVLESVLALRRELDEAREELEFERAAMSAFEWQRINAMSQAEVEKELLEAGYTKERLAAGLAEIRATVVKAIAARNATGA